MRDFAAGQVLLFDKPFDWSSFDLVKKVKIILRKKYGKTLKVGHAGTLDPYATGLLVICTGKATKTIQEIQDAPKTYTGTFVLGATTPSYDLESEPDTFFPTEHITPELIESVRQSFIGAYMQTPPIFSAKKVDGKRAYELARKGKEVKLEAREVHIYSFVIHPSDSHTLEFEVVCSKGTYIRSLANDFGERLQSGAYLGSLRRTAIGDYRIENAGNWERLAEELGVEIKKREGSL